METKLAKLGKPQKVETEKWSNRAPCPVRGCARAPEGLGSCPCVQSITVDKARQPRRYSACARRVATAVMPVLQCTQAEAHWPSTCVCLPARPPSHRLLAALAVLYCPRALAREASARRAEGKQKKTQLVAACAYVRMSCARACLWAPIWTRKP